MVGSVPRDYAFPCQLDKDQFFITQVDNANTTEHLYYIAIVDFDNLVDEENEENNIATTLEAVPTHETLFGEI